MDREERRRIELILNDHEYGCTDFCGDIPRFTWNICPLCICGLIPIFLVFFSAAFRVDYVNDATVAAAQIINQLGLSYTVYYTAGCWSREDVGDGTIVGLAENNGLRGSGDSPPCSTDYGFEVAAAEYDAMSGHFLRTKNVTGIRAKHIDSVKVTPDWRFVTFVGTLPASSIREAASTDAAVGPTLWVVGAAETDTAHATRLLTVKQMSTLDSRCQDHARRVFHPFQDAGEQTTAAPATGAPTTPASTTSSSVTATSMSSAASSADSTSVVPDTESVFAGASAASANSSAPERRATAGNIIGLYQSFRWLMAASARVTAFKHLQIILAPSKSSEDGAASQDGEFRNAAASRQGAVYRAAFAFECTATGGSGEVLTYSQLALLDYEVYGSNSTNTWSPLNITGATSRLHLVDATPTAPDDASLVEAETSAQLTSQSCPRFVPSSFGAELLFVAEAVKPLANEMLEQLPQGPARVLPARRLAVVGVPAAAGQAGEGAVDEASAVALLPWGDGGVPYAPVHGCPEFAKSLFKKSESFGDSLSFDGTLDSLMASDKKASEKEVPKASLVQHKQQDTFTFMSDPTSSSVLGIDAQEVAVSLNEGMPRGRVSRAHLLYNVDEVGGSQLRLEGCQPIRAAGRKGHMGFERVVEKTWATFDIPNEKSHYTAWLACLTADQRIAIVESAKRKHWVNMSMPNPQWTGLPSQGMWCRASRGEGCFEVWSNPNPNEDMFEEYFENS